MSKCPYEIEVAITAEGECLVSIAGRILPFSDLEELGDFIDLFAHKKDQCLYKITPLDDQMASEVTTDTINWMESVAKRLPTSEEIVIRADNSRQSEMSTVYQEVNAKGQPVPHEEAKIGMIFIKNRYLEEEVPRSITVRVSLPQNKT